MFYHFSIFLIHQKSLWKKLSVFSSSKQHCIQIGLAYSRVSLSRYSSDEIYSFLFVFQFWHEPASECSRIQYFCDPSVNVFSFGTSLRQNVLESNVSVTRRERKLQERAAEHSRLRRTSHLPTSLCRLPSLPLDLQLKF